MGESFYYKKVLYLVGEVEQACYYETACAKQELEEISKTMWDSDLSENEKHWLEIKACQLRENIQTYQDILELKKDDEKAEVDEPEISGAPPVAFKSENAVIVQLQTKLENQRSE